MLRIFLRAVETALKQASHGAPAGARFGAVAFCHLFGATLNSHPHVHVLALDGVFRPADDGEAVDLTEADIERVQAPGAQARDALAGAARLPG